VLLSFAFLCLNQKEIGGIPRRPADNPRSYRSPAEHGIPFTSHMIKCSDSVLINSWFLLQKSNPEKAPTIIFFHGNAGNIGLRLPNAAQMYSRLQANILMVEYRGYGDSDTVKPNEKGLKLDAEAALDFALNHPSIDSERIFVFGRSLGGAVAFHLALYAHKQNKPLAGIIVENTFLSISKMVDQLMPLIAPLKFLVLRMDWNSEVVAPRIQTPVLYLAGDRDELVPHSHMKTLYSLSTKASSYAKIHIIRGGTHNDSWVMGGREYFEHTKAFMSHVVLNGKELARTSSFDQDNEGSSFEVNMGGEIQYSDAKSSIPIMPKNILGIAKEATKSFKTSDDVSDKKKEI